MSIRNRSQGWKHAKISGHRNEELIAEKIMNDSEFSNQLKATLKKNCIIKKVEADGFKSQKVIDVFGSKTTQKTDLKIIWENNSFTNFSIKKSKAGQVFLISFENFIKGFELQFNLKIPKDVKRALSLFINGAKDIESILLNEEYQKTDKKILMHERKKKRLTWETLKKYDYELTEALLFWLKENIRDLILFCFQRGLAKQEYDWAEYLWYYNTIGENNNNILIKIDKIAEELSSLKYQKNIIPGDRTGGTTIKLPFGFLQWHQKKLQFRHKMDLIIEDIT